MDRDLGLSLCGHWLLDLRHRAYDRDCAPGASAWQGPTFIVVRHDGCSSRLCWIPQHEDVGPLACRGTGWHTTVICRMWHLSPARWPASEGRLELFNVHSACKNSTDNHPHSTTPFFSFTSYTRITMSGKQSLSCSLGPGIECAYSRPCS